MATGRLAVAVPLGRHPLLADVAYALGQYTEWTAAISAEVAAEGPEGTTGKPRASAPIAC
jgi:hypothetical protein